MAELTLQAYEERIRQLLDSEQYEEAIVWSQHLLRTFPKYIRGYEYLAQAALEVGREDEALELFRRVLSADPENVVAYTGIALIFSNANVLNEAIWHMMRAFELQPGAHFIREQLRDLYAQHEGRRPGRLKLNRAALGRIHLRNGQYDMAIREFEAELAEDANRVDLRVALAEAYWRAGRYREAVEQAELVLQELPLALKPNLIMGQFYAQEGDMDQANEYFQVAQRLDPENRVAKQLFGNRSTLTVREVTIAEPGQEPEPEPESFEEAADFTWAFDEIEGLEGLEGVELPALESPHEPESPAQPDWRHELRRATEEALADVAVVTPDWRDELRRATEEALAGVPTGEEPAEWRADLRAAIGDAMQPLADLPAVEVPERPPWVVELRAATHDALIERERVPHSPADEQPAPADAPTPWTHELRRATDQALAEAEAATPRGAEVEPARAVEPAQVSPPAWVEELHRATLRAFESPVAPPAWVEALRHETDEAIQSSLEPAAPPQPATEEAPPEPEPAAPPQPAAEEAPPEPEPAAPPEPAAEEALPEPEPAAPPEPIAEEALPEPEPAAPPEPAAEEAPPEPEPAAPPEPIAEEALPEPEQAAPPEPVAEDVVDELERARRLAFAGQEEAALELIAAIVKTGGRDAEVIALLADWVATDTTGPRPHQLLGDLYQQAGRIHEALEQFRLALQKL